MKSQATQLFSNLDGVSLYCPGWSAVSRSRLTAPSASWVQAILPRVSSASGVAGITGFRHHARLIFVFLVETGFHRVELECCGVISAHSNLFLPGSSDSQLEATSASSVARITGMYPHT
ncbi:EEF1A lysine methyltransferase 2 [Plecturocebus cupreus]